MEIMRLIIFFLLTAIVFKEENICLLSVQLYKEYDSKVGSWKDLLMFLKEISSILTKAVFI